MESKQRVENDRMNQVPAKWKRVKGQRHGQKQPCGGYGEGTGPCNETANPTIFVDRTILADGSTCVRLMALAGVDATILVVYMAKHVKIMQILLPFGLGTRSKKIMLIATAALLAY